MTRNRVLLVAIALGVIAIAGVWFATRAGQVPPVIDFVQKFPEAQKQPAESASDRFAVKDEQIDGKTLRAIYARPNSRITWTVTLPTDPWLKTAIGIDPQAWNQDGDGVLFFIGVDDGGHYTQLLTQHLDPRAEPRDRRWITLTLDLAPYSGHTVKIIFNTRSSLPGRPEDTRNDFAYWGAPGITLRP